MSGMKLLTQDNKKDATAIEIKMPSEPVNKFGDTGKSPQIENSITELNAPLNSNELSFFTIGGGDGQPENAMPVTTTHIPPNKFFCNMSHFRQASRQYYQELCERESREDNAANLKLQAEHNVAEKQAEENNQSKSNGDSEQSEKSRY